ncbi:MAG TPA: hypothetical protein QGH10_18070 [Armatimonadota bacterium]|nr:hypothetical protein [Armatimonadota bacterium]
MANRTIGLKLGLVGLLILSAAVVYAAVSLNSLAPASNAVPGWEALNADKLAANQDELWKIYNGGDGPWKTAGVTTAFQRYYKNTKVLTLIVHRTGGDWKKAKALYVKKDAAIKEQEGYQTVTLAKGAGSLATPGQGTQAHFWNKYYYCTIQINGTSAAEVTAAKTFITKISTTITAKG